MIEKYNNAFYEAFDLDKGTDLTKLEYQSIDEWDSIGHMTLMSELEDNFDITISTEDLIQFESYKQGTDILERYSIKFNKMLIEKPLVVDKFRSFERYLKKNNRQIGTKQRGLDINLRNACNLKCEHCFTMSPLNLGIENSLDQDTINSIGDHAHELGIFELDLQGGELLLNKNYLFETLKSLAHIDLYT